MYAMWWLSKNCVPRKQGHRHISTMRLGLTKGSIQRFCRSSIAFFHCEALCFTSSKDITFFVWSIIYLLKFNLIYTFQYDKKIHTVQILKCDGLVTWTLRSLGLSDHTMSPFATSLDGSTYIIFGLSVRISWTFLFANLFIFFTFEIITMDSPGSRKSCLPIQ